MNLKEIYTKEVVMEQEKTLQFEKFSNELGFQIAQDILQTIQEKGWKNVRIQITYEGEVIFHYLMDGKRGTEWLDRKTKTVLVTGHSSLFTYLDVENEEFQEMKKDRSYSIGGGGFPIKENGELKGVICVSGLDHMEDHYLIVEAVKKLI